MDIPLIIFLSVITLLLGVCLDNLTRIANTLDRIAAKLLEPPEAK